MIHNPDFAGWTRQTAFAIHLAEWAITELLIMENYEERAKTGGYPDHGLSLNRSASSYLNRRGLIKRCEYDGYGGNWVRTEVGACLCQLLRAAGFKTALDDDPVEKSDATS